MVEETAKPGISRIQGSLIVGLLFLLLVVPLIPSAAPPRWEYIIEAIPDDSLVAKMNELGKYGWKAVSARRASDGSEYAPSFRYEIIFKRPVSRSTFK